MTEQLPLQQAREHVHSIVVLITGFVGNYKCEKDNCCCADFYLQAKREFCGAVYTNARKNQDAFQEVNSCTFSAELFAYRGIQQSAAL